MSLVSHPVFVVGSIVYLSQKCPNIQSSQDLAISAGLFIALKQFFNWKRFKRHVEGNVAQLMDLRGD
jgi:hypothetical protein